MSEVTVKITCGLLSSPIITAVVVRIDGQFAEITIPEFKITSCAASANADTGYNVTYELMDLPRELKSLTLKKNFGSMCWTNDGTEETKSYMLIKLDLEDKEITMIPYQIVYEVDSSSDLVKNLKKGFYKFNEGYAGYGSETIRFLMENDEEIDDPPSDTEEIGHQPKNLDLDTLFEKPFSLGQKNVVSVNYTVQNGSLTNTVSSIPVYFVMEGNHIDIILNGMTLKQTTTNNYITLVPSSTSLISGLLPSSSLSLGFGNLALKDISIFDTSYLYTAEYTLESDGKIKIRIVSAKSDYTSSTSIQESTSLTLSDILVAIYPTTLSYVKN